MFLKRAPLFLALLILTSACCRPKLTLFSDYILRENLASYRIRTPDPALNCPRLGQRLYVSWDLKSLGFSLPLDLKLSIRFGNRTEIEEHLMLTSYCGTYVYTLIDEEYFEKNGILTYKAEIFEGDVLIEEWRHHLWVERIVFVEAEAEDAQAKIEQELLKAKAQTYKIEGSKGCDLEKEKKKNKKKRKSKRKKALKGKSSAPSEESKNSLPAEKGKNKAAPLTQEPLPKAADELEKKALPPEREEELKKEKSTD